MKKKLGYIWSEKALHFCFWIKMIAMASCLGHVSSSQYSCENLQEIVGHQ